MSDRRVHASHIEGEEIVRYDRQGKWYIEIVPPSPHAPWRRQVPISTAAARAKELEKMGGTIHFGVQGGNNFDRKVRANG
jgi:hypothetical protein